ncbi:glycosyltransferase family 4 protein [Tunicatimonas pelagia]|uniref:glycosyltransferase family 4 protein n=1 Tax=Tunicatimonas pelagia TaxID=931531 RepID=UPI002665A7DA|nr:glycosyltransferase family 4 protein [Tunicatimonas pelagia]WKN41974.1 glycosyltransferase family 4 protein [Tunicatimonas pelagia]
MSVQKILFIHAGSFSMVNAVLKDKLQDSFPDYPVHDLEMYDVLRKNKVILFLNIFHFVKEYGADFILGRRKIREARRFFVSTLYIFDFFKNHLEKNIDISQYVFSLQTQSIYDFELHGLPHFIYTDHTNLCNFFYPTLSLAPSRLVKSDMYHARETELYQNTRKIFVMGNHTKQSLVHQYGIDERNVVEVGCGGNISVPATINTSKYWAKNILFVGDRWELKGGWVLIEAFKIARKHYPEATLNIVGSKPPVADVEGCYAVERVPLDVLKSYYEQASIFCMPSIVETFGIVFVEAMYYRLPIVTSNIGSNSFTIQDGVSGIITDGSVYQISRALISLLGNEEKCQTYGEAGYKLACEKYTWNVILDQMSSEISSEVRSLRGDRYQAVRNGS